MKFEVVNSKNKVVMNTKYKTCVPDCKTITSMSRAGYRFKLNGKITGLKKLQEWLKEEDD